MVKTYTAEELKEILEKHKRWLYNHEGTQECANLSDANLSAANLRGANLRGANLRGANLRGANLRGADLSAANLYGADLRGANLMGANLSDANLIAANLSAANLSAANLRGANLRGADLSDANLRGLSGNLCHVKSIQTETYYITYTSKVIQIGCQIHTIEKWKNFDDETIKKMDSKALEWWKKWKPVLMQIIELAPCEEIK